ncbi:hypothetical protein RUM44_004842 [Polyplax serrata]|uniref:Uncharacterized protein n=1 Tax=Polyplax serrata TaxID=468196 RepID=A0ABR1B3Z2_POLSC
MAVHKSSKRSNKVRASGSPSPEGETVKDDGIPFVVGWKTVNRQGPRQIDEKVRDTTGNPDGIPGWTKTTPTDFERVNRLLLRSPPDRGACVKMKKQITERIAVRTRVVRVGGAEGTKKIFTRT